VVIRGGAGDDTIYGSEYNDQIYGDGGENYLYGLGGNDRFYCRTNPRDHIDGGEGTDVLYVGSVAFDSTGIEYIIYS
jgi:Ca2+-binding RTX toxin-like protein